MNGRFVPLRCPHCGAEVPLPELMENGTPFVSVSDKILRHLRRIHAANEDDTRAPHDATQSGISEALGITRANAAITLSRLEKQGMTERRLCPIVGTGRRLLAFRITYAGAVYIANENGGRR